MNKLGEMGKTNLEVMKMRRNNRENPFPLRKYYGVMIVGFVLFLGIMAYYSIQFRQKREIAKQEVELEQKSVGVNNRQKRQQKKVHRRQKQQKRQKAQ